MSTVTARVAKQLESHLIAANLEKVPPERLSETIAEGFESATFLNDLDYDQVVEDLLLETPLPLPEPRFPFRFILTVNDFFFVEVLLWFTDPTSVHNHPFNGAAYILDGDSVNIQVEFEQHGEENGIRWGKLTPQKLKRIKRGEIFQFHPKRDFIHRVFHLNHRCATIRVGLSQDRGSAYQDVFLAPGLALCGAFAGDKAIGLRFRLLERIYRFDRSAFDASLDRLIQSGHADAVVWSLAEFQNKNPNYPAFEKHIAPSPYFSSALKEKIQEAFTFAVGDPHFLDENLYSPDAALFSGIVSGFGFSHETLALFQQWVGENEIKPWVKKALMDLSLSESANTSVAWHLLDRVNRIEKNLGLDSPVRELGVERNRREFFESAWKLSNFENFLNA